MEQTDGDVIRRSIREPDAFAEIFDRHLARIHGYLARRGGREVADELTSEVFTVAFAKRATFDCARAEALPWLYGIASRLAMNHRRAHRRYLSAGARQAPDCEPGFDERVLDRVAASEQRDLVRRLLAEMSPDEVTTLVLYAWEDLTYAEVAEALSIPIGTVRSRLHRIRARADQMAPIDPDETTLDAPVQALTKGPRR